MAAFSLLMGSLLASCHFTTAAMSPEMPAGHGEAGALGSGTPSAGGGVTAVFTVPPVYWNAWWESGAASDEPTTDARTTLKPKTQYNLHLDLARVRFQLPGVQSSLVAPGLAKVIKEQLADPEAPDTLELTVLALPERGFFAERDISVKPLILNLRAVQRTQDEIDEEQLSLEQLLASSLGLVSFSLKTIGRTGRTAVALAIWHDSTPVDELIVDACVGTSAECAATERSASIERGLSGFRSLTHAAPDPDGALHIVELSPGKKLIGVLRRRGWEAGKYVSWELDYNARQFKEQFTSTLKDTLDDAMNAKSSELEARGIGIARKLFNTATPQGRAARLAFDELVADSITEGAAGVRKPSLFVRTLMLDSTEPLVLPMGMLAAKVKGKTEFLGFHVNVEVPMPRQSYGVQTECVGEWVLALPTLEDTELKRAWETIREVSPWNTLQPGFGNDATKFRDWLADEDAAAKGTLLVVLAHHEKDRLWFDPGRKVQVTSADVGRFFAEPSVVIMNGCGTGSGESDFIRQFNARGATSAIVTNTQVSGRMAGAFLKCLADALPATGAQKKLSEIYMSSVLCLKDASASLTSDETYGARALAYSFVGNGNVTICR